MTYSPAQEEHLPYNPLHDLIRLLRKIDRRAYILPARMLGHATVGQHVRHILELTQCLLQGYATSHVNYDARKRDLSLEQDPDTALALAEDLANRLALPDKPLWLVQTAWPVKLVPSFYSREVMYNAEHAIHHMALIRVALREMELNIVDEHFGVAPATMRHRRSTAER